MSFLSTLLDYANPCRNLTFQTIRLGSKERNGTNSQFGTARIRAQELCKRRSGYYQLTPTDPVVQLVRAAVRIPEVLGSNPSGVNLSICSVEFFLLRPPNEFFGRSYFERGLHILICICTFIIKNN